MRKLQWAGAVVVTVAGATVVFSCVGDDHNGGNGDASDATSDVATNPPDANADVSVDAPSDAGPTLCDPKKVFSTIAVLPGFGTAAQESHPSLSPDELTMYFFGAGGALSDGSTKNDLYKATRTKITDNFGTPSKLAISTSLSDQNPAIAANGLTLYFETYSDAGPPALWFAQRASTLADFTTSALLGQPPALPTSGLTTHDQQPFITADNAELWFTSNRAGGTSDDIYASTLSGTTFGDPVTQATLNSTLHDWNPTLSADRLTIYFSTDRVATPHYDIWASHRTSTADAFPAPAVVPELNMAGFSQYAAWLSADNCRLYFESDRAGTPDIYVAQRTP